MGHEKVESESLILSDYRSQLRLGKLQQKLNRITFGLAKKLF